MDYPTLLRYLEGHLRLLDARGTKYIGLESFEGEELAELKEGLKRLVPKASKKNEAPIEEGSSRPRQKPTQMIRRFLDDQKSSQPFQKKIRKPQALVEKTKLAEMPLNQVPNQAELIPTEKEPEAVSAVEAGSLEELLELYKDCMRCPLGSGRNKLVFGHGISQTPLMFIGEGPGADEDAQGEPFVGRAGKLLTKMIHSIGIDREDVYITNVVKCRPPGNRNPEPVEVASCMRILENQLKLVSPKLIVTLGNVPTRALLPDIQGITKVRGKPVQYKQWTMLPTFHPSYLLRNRTAMPLAWKDFRMIASMAFEIAE